MSAPAIPASVYRSPKLYGDFLVTPMRSYDDAMRSGYSAGCSCKNVAVAVAHFVTGLIVYTLMGFFAAIGMIVKKAHASDIQSDDEHEIQSFTLAFANVSTLTHSNTTDTTGLAHMDFKLGVSNSEAQKEAALIKMRELKGNFERFFTTFQKYSPASDTASSSVPAREGFIRVYYKPDAS